MFNLGEEFVKHQEALFKYAMYLTHDSEEAKELLQETAVTVLANSNQYNDNGKFAACVCTIIRNNHINKVAKTNYRATNSYSVVSD